MSEKENIFTYIGKSINRAIDFMVDRAWFDLVSVMAAFFIPEQSNFSTAFQRVVFVLMFTVALFIIRESVSQVHVYTQPTNLNLGE
jgi:hypothetical protein